MSATLPKSKKLKSRKLIQKLFATGKTYRAFPLIVRVAIIKGEMTQAGFSVAKRNHKLAVHRNHIKRLMREAYRLNQDQVHQEDGINFALMFIYTDRKIADYATVEKAMMKILETITRDQNTA